MDKVRLIPVSRTELVIPHTARRNSIGEIVRWMENRARAKLPEQAFAGEDFDTGLDVAAPALAFTGSHADKRYWVARLRFEDAEEPSRSWHTEIVVTDIGPDDRMVVRLDVMDTDEGFDAAPFSRSIPGFVQQICKAATCIDGATRLTDQPILMEDVASFETLVFDPDRRRPALIFGGAKGGTKLDTQRKLDINWLAERLSGVAHVGILTEEPSRDITHRYGKAFSVFGNAAKLYLPEIDPGSIDPFDHPLFYLRRVSVTDLLGQLIWYNLSQRQADPLPRFGDIIRPGSIAGSDTEDLEEIDQLRSELTRSQSEIVRLTSEAAGFDMLFEEAAARERQADALVQGAQARADRLRDHNRFYADALNRLPLSAIGRLDLQLPAAGIFDTWLKLTCGDSVVLTDRARKSVDTLPEEESWFERFGVALRGISDLVEGRVSLTGKNIPVGWGVELSPCGKIEGFDDYSFMHEGRKYRSTWHAKWGSGTDLRHAFRIYFHWDTDGRRALIQSIDEHFDTKRTN